MHESFSNSTLPSRACPVSRVSKPPCQTALSHAPDFCVWASNLCESSNWALRWRRASGSVECLGDSSFRGRSHRRRERELLNFYTNILYQRASDDAFGENGTHGEHCADRSHQDQVSHSMAASALATLGSRLGGLQFRDRQPRRSHPRESQPAQLRGRDGRVGVLCMHMHTPATPVGV